MRAKRKRGNVRAKPGQWLATCRDMIGFAAGNLQKAGQWRAENVADKMVGGAREHHLSLSGKLRAAYRQDAETITHSATPGARSAQRRIAKPCLAGR